MGKSQTEKFIIWIFASSLQAHNWPLDITGECLTVNQSERVKGLASQALTEAIIT